MDKLKKPIHDAQTEQCVKCIVSGSALFQDYLKYKYMPTVDRLLDWRNRLVEKRDDDVINPPDWYNREIAAVDYLLELQMLNNLNSERL